MKVRFRPQPKPGEEIRDRGLEVLYAPARRAAFQLRWYLLVLLLASPLLYAATRFVWTAVVVEAPGVVSVRRIEMRSTTQGYVERIDARVGDSVQQGQTLVRLAHPEWQKAARRYAAEAQRLREAHAGATSGRERAQARLAFYRERLASMQRLRAQGAATAAEVAAARAALDGVEDQLRASIADANRLAELELEHTLASERLAGLEQASPASGRLAELLVEPGEFVTWGTPLAVVTASDDVAITAYLAPRHVRYAEPGQPATIHLPDGTKIPARVAEGPDAVLRLPPEMAAPLVARKLSLIVPLEPLEPLPPALLIDHLPVDVRFEFSWRRSMP